MEHDEFIALLQPMEAQLSALLRCAPASNGQPLPRGANGMAVYLFSDQDRPKYVGRTMHLRNRYACHIGRDIGRNESSFARRLVKAQPGLSLPDAYALIKGFQFRFVQMNTEHEMHLFEIYAAYRLGTPFYGLSPVRP